MARQRSIVSLILVFLATFLISCSGPSVATAPQVYTPAQLEKIQGYAPKIEAVRERSQELENLIQTKQWINVGNFIHGPMTEARLNMNYITSNLFPKDQTIARQLTRDLFDHLVKIDQAASEANSQKALSNYQAAYSDIDQFLQLLPKPSSQPEES